MGMGRVKFCRFRVTSSTVRTTGSHPNGRWCFFSGGVPWFLGAGSAEAHIAVSELQARRVTYLTKLACCKPPADRRPTLRGGPSFRHELLGEGNGHFHGWHLLGARGRRCCGGHQRGGRRRGPQGAKGRGIGRARRTRLVRGARPCLRDPQHRVALRRVRELRCPP